MIQKGIVDPAKVVRAALQDAASVAGLLVTTEAMVAEMPKDARHAGNARQRQRRHGLLTRSVIPGAAKRSAQRCAADPGSHDALSERSKGAEQSAPFFSRARGPRETPSPACGRDGKGGGGVQLRGNLETSHGLPNHHHH
jgi:hypothetical protein